jgi:hypothetical protein
VGDVHTLYATRSSEQKLLYAMSLEVLCHYFRIRAACGGASAMSPTLFFSFSFSLFPSKLMLDMQNFGVAPLFINILTLVFILLIFNFYS